MKTKLTLLIIWITQIYFCQNQLIVPPTIRLPKDSIESKTLLYPIQEFLKQKELPNEENKLVSSNNRLETYLVLDEMKGIEKSGKFKDDFFYKPYLTNLIPLQDNVYKVQLSYIGIAENTPYLIASFDFLMHKEGNQFFFSSPLKENTQLWKTITLDHYTFFYENDFQLENAKEFVKLSTIFDKKLKAPEIQSTIYCTKDVVKTMQLFGINYMAKYNGYPYDNFTTKSGNQFLGLFGSKNGDFGKPELHDLWHNRLHNVVSTSIIYKPLDEACAYLYAGSWDYTWKEIWEKFEYYLSKNKDINWLDNYGKFQNFGDSQEKHLYPEYVINALIVQKIEKEKGFDAVVEFLKCGKYNKDNYDNYFTALEKYTGITKKTFNKKVGELIKKEKIQ